MVKLKSGGRTGDKQNCNLAGGFDALNTIKPEGNLSHPRGVVETLRNKRHGCKFDDGRTRCVLLTSVGDILHPPPLERYELERASDDKLTSTAAVDYGSILFSNFRRMNAR